MSHLYYLKYSLTLKFNDNQNKLVDIFSRSVDKQNKAIYNLSSIQKYVDNLQKEVTQLNALKSQFSECISINNRTSKESINLIKHKTNDFENKLKKLNVIITSLKRSK